MKRSARPVRWVLRDRTGESSPYLRGPGETAVYTHGKEYHVDWDGIGTFALFLSTGGVGMGIIALRAYQAKLAARIEFERIRRSNERPGDVTDQLQELEARVHQLTERADFTERLLEGRSAEPSDGGEAL